MSTLADIVYAVAEGVCLDPYVESDGDDRAHLGEFLLERDDDALCVYLVRGIPGGQHADRVAYTEIPCDSVNAEARAAIALLRAWVNQSLDYAELAATQPEE